MGKWERSGTNLWTRSSKDAQLFIQLRRAARGCGFQRVFGKTSENFFDFRIPALDELEEEHMNFNGRWRCNARIGG
jgi:hypothetical protein